MLEHKSPTTLETPEIHTIPIETDHLWAPAPREGGQPPLPVIRRATPSMLQSARIDDPIVDKVAKL
jgi:hypothetical protein